MLSEEYGQITGVKFHTKINFESKPLQKCHCGGSIHELENMTFQSLYKCDTCTKEFLYLPNKPVCSMCRSGNITHNFHNGSPDHFVCRNCNNRWFSLWHQRILQNEKSGN